MVHDYIVVGAGSAGCVLALRLAQAGHSVALVEAGGTDAGPFIQMPAALSYPMNMAAYDWGYQTEPEPQLGNRRLACPRGRVLGGSSSINGMVFVRGNPQDFDHWRDCGATGWDFASVLPYFQRMETAHGAPSAWRGTTGPLHVTRGPQANPLYAAFVQAGRVAGYGVTKDYNGHCQEGFGPMDMTVWRGRRWSSANAYLRPALKTGKVRMVARAHVTRILFDGKKAVGVEYRAGRILHKIGAAREVILAAGAINSPMILLRSGVGPGRQLGEHGIAVVASRPGVGANLQDHLELYVQMKCTKPVTLNASLNLWSKALIGLRWLLTKTGPGATNHFESGAFIRSRAGVKYPDIELHFLPAAVRYDGKAPTKAHGFQVHVGPMRSLARGRVRLTGPEISNPPSILFNYMSGADDWADFRTSVRLVREILAASPFDQFRGAELAPGAEVQSDTQLNGYLRDHVESAFHPCGTCAMGAPRDAGAVVDPACRVIGADRLRVVDASIFPRITNGNLNAPTIMVAEKAADHILGRAPLPASTLVPWEHPTWATTQR
ncbi:MAG: choline dehydrogenase [Alphaproteobacteria bacterium]